MKLQFDKNQQYQLDAIAAVIDLFEGQDLNTSDFEFSLSDHATGSLQFTEAGVGNRLTIAPEQILTNLHKIVTNCHESPKVSHLKFQARRTGASRNAVPACQNKNVTT